MSWFLKKSKTLQLAFLEADLSEIRIRIDFRSSCGNLIGYENY